MTSCHAMRMLWVAAALLLCRPASCVHAASLEEQFARPPAAAMPGVWWRWIDGNVTREGITRDLTEMARKGIRSIDVFDVGGGMPAGPAGMMGPQWRALFRHALAEAARLGVEVRLTAAAGWGMGGPWIDAEHATKKLVHTEIQVQGPTRLTQALPKPPGSEPFYVDVAVVAFRVPDDAPPAPSQVVASSEVGNYCTAPPANSLAAARPTPRGVELVQTDGGESGAPRITRLRPRREVDRGGRMCRGCPSSGECRPSRASSLTRPRGSPRRRDPCDGPSGVSG